MDIFFCDACAARVTDSHLRRGHGFRSGDVVICAKCIETGHGADHLERLQHQGRAISQEPELQGAGILDELRDRRQTLPNQEEVVLSTDELFHEDVSDSGSGGEQTQRTTAITSRPEPEEPERPLLETDQDDDEAEELVDLDEVDVMATQPARTPPPREREDDTRSNEVLPAMASSHPDTVDDLDEDPSSLLLDSEDDVEVEMDEPDGTSLYSAKDRELAAQAGQKAPGAVASPALEAEMAPTAQSRSTRKAEQRAPSSNRRVASRAGNSKAANRTRDKSRARSTAKSSKAGNKGRSTGSGSNRGAKAGSRVWLGPAIFVVGLALIGGACYGAYVYFTGYRHQQTETVDPYKEMQQRIRHVDSQVQSALANRELEQMRAARAAFNQCQQAVEGEFTDYLKKNGYTDRGIDDALTRMGYRDLSRRVGNLRMVLNAREMGQ
ncbi:MAG: hypothetical protein ACOCXA_03955 [Planctomycetota bacterium]